MDDIKEFYILGIPIETTIGNLHQTYMRDYLKLYKYVGILTFDKNDLIKYLQDLVASDNMFEPILHYANTVTLFEFIIFFRGDEYEKSFIRDLYLKYRELFKFCFKEDVFDKIQNNEEFEYLIQLIKNVNDIKYEKPNPNPEIARFDRLKQKLKAAKGESITFEAMYSSVLLSSGIHPNDMTIYQFNKAFDRIGHFKNYETTTLFKTVDASGKVEITPWYGTTQEEKPSVITEEQLNRAKAQMDRGGLQSDL